MDHGTGGVSGAAAAPLVIEARHGWSALRLAEVWRYRELLVFLTWRDIKVRYKQAVLGVAWAVLAPFVTMVVFTIVFSRLLGVQVPEQYPGVPYAVFSYTGLLPWALFSGALQKAGSSLVGSSSLLTKVYFPRLIIPMSAIFGGLPDFLISFAVLGGLMAWFNIVPTWNVVWLPALVALALLTSFSFGLWLSALNVLYRDVGYIIPFVIQLWMYLSPVAYPIDNVQGSWKIVYGLNPMAGVIQGFRWALLGGDAPDKLVILSATIVVTLMVGGLFYFKRMERSFADVV